MPMNEFVNVRQDYEPVKQVPVVPVAAVAEAAPAEVKQQPLQSLHDV